MGDDRFNNWVKEHEQQIQKIVETSKKDYQSILGELSAAWSMGMELTSSHFQNIIVFGNETNTTLRNLLRSAFYKARRND